MTRIDLRSTWCLGVAAALAIAAWHGRCPAAESAPPAPTAAQIDRAIEQLGDAKFEVRQAASQWLWKAGKAAEPALEKACSSADAEVVYRAREILAKFRWEIYPDTPPKVVEAINLFRRGDIAEKRQACQRLVELGEDCRIFRLIGREPDESLRKSLLDQFYERLDRAVASLLLRGDFDGAEELELLWSVWDKPHARDYAALLLARGRLGGAIEQTREGLKSRPDAEGYLRLAYMLRANGDFAAAIDAAGKSGNEALVDDTLFQAGDWAELAKRWAAPIPARGADNIERLGYVAAYQRLAGQTAEFNQTLAAIIKHGRESPEDSWPVGKALLINERIDDAVDLCLAPDPQRSFDILCGQGRYREAFRRAGLGDPSSSWSDAVHLRSSDDAVSAGRAFRLGCATAQTLYRLGEAEQAHGLARKLASSAGDAPENEQVAWLGALCECELALGLPEQAWEHASMIPIRNDAIGSSFLYSDRQFKRQAVVAALWWRALRAEHPQDKEVATLDRLRGLFAKPPAGPPLEEVRKLAARLEEDTVLAASDPSRRAWLLGLVATFLAEQGHLDLALRFAEKSAKETPSASAADRMVDRLLNEDLLLGDILAQQGRWADAAQAYRDAYAKGNPDARALYLLGRANLHLGKDAEGRREMETALLLPLGDVHSRHYQLMVLLRRLKNEPAAIQRAELLVKMGMAGDWDALECRQMLAVTATTHGDHLMAAGHWERFLLRCLNTNTSFERVEDYLVIAHHIHETRARGLLKAGKNDEAIEELHRAERILPADIQLAIDSVPELQHAGRRAEADALFGRALAVQETICRDFPRSATHHNNLAWMAANLDRELDKALEHARRAVELQPDSAAYLDTLAEVHFRRGNAAEALRLEKRCGELEPDSPHVRKQLERFGNSKAGQ